MCRMLAIACVLLLTSKSVGAQQPSVKPSAPRKPSTMSATVLAHAGYFLASEQASKDIYGNGLVYGGELRLASQRVLARRLAIWAEGTYRTRRGALSFTREATTMSVTGLEAGALYQPATNGRLLPYFGGGAGYYAFDEKNEPIGEARQGKIGYCAVCGVAVTAWKALVVDVRIKYSVAKMQPADFPIDVGGLTASIGFGARF